MADSALKHMILHGFDARFLLRTDEARYVASRRKIEFALLSVPMSSAAMPAAVRQCDAELRYTCMRENGYNAAWLVSLACKTCFEVRIGMKASTTACSHPHAYTGQHHRFFVWGSFWAASDKTVAYRLLGYEETTLSG